MHGASRHSWREFQSERFQKKSGRLCSISSVARGAYYKAVQAIIPAVQALSLVDMQDGRSNNQAALVLMEW
jgi:hypothetical protein